MKSWFTITNKSETESEICIYDEIGMWGITAKDFLNDLKAVGERKVILRINSPGGEVFDGLAIYNRLREHKGGVEVKIDGIAASMASVIAMAGSPVTMAENALMMIHNPAGICIGEADDMRDLADLLDKVKGSLTRAYERKTGQSNADIVKMMDEETWLDATEARALGFCDEITDTNKMAAKFEKLALTGKLAEREKAIDTKKKSTISKTNSMETPTETSVVTEPIATVVAPIETPALDVAAISAKAAGDAVASERERVTAIRAWSKEVSNVQRIDLSKVTDDFIANGKSLAEFKDHVITNTFKPVNISTPTDHSLANGRTLTRAEFDKLSPFNQSDFCRKGGKISD